MLEIYYFQFVLNYFSSSRICSYIFYFWNSFTCFYRWHWWSRDKQGEVTNAEKYSCFYCSHSNVDYRSSANNIILHDHDYYITLNNNTSKGSLSSNEIGENIAQNDMEVDYLDNQVIFEDSSNQNHVVELDQGSIMIANLTKELRFAKYKIKISQQKCAVKNRTIASLRSKIHNLEKQRRKKELIRNKLSVRKIILRLLIKYCDWKEIFFLYFLLVKLVGYRISLISSTENEFKFFSMKHSLYSNRFK